MTHLQGVRIALTRSAQGNEEWNAALHEAGALPVDWPCLDFRVIEDSKAALERIVSSANWLALSSARGARSLAELLGEEGLEELRGSKMRFACVGDATASALEEFGLGCDLVAPQGTAKSLGEVLVDQSDSKDSFAVLGALDGRRDLAEALEQASRFFVELALYETMPKAVHAGEALPELDAVFFASPSAVRSFTEHWELPRSVPAISIGPSTSEAMIASGLHISAESNARQAEGMLAALEDVLAQKSLT